MSDDLPDGWATVSLEELSAPVPGACTIGPFGSNLKVSDYQPSGVPLVFVREIRAEQFGNTNSKFITPAKAHELRAHVVRGGDLLITKMGEPPGDTAVYPEAAPPAVITADCIKLSPDWRVTSSRFLRLWLRSSPVRFQIVEQTMGVAQQKLSLARFRSITIPLPPCAEQQRIVAKVEALLARVNAARERLAQVPAILKRFRQSVLAAACSGRLTAEWRAEQTDLEPTSVLMKRIEAKRTKPFRQVDAAELPVIPECWSWVYLPELGYMNRGKSRHRPRNAPHLYSGPYPFIQTGDIAQSGGRITSHKQTYSEAGLAQSRLWSARTICITIAANIADSAILTYPACFPDSVVGLIAEPSFCITEYSEFFIRTARDDLSQFAPATAQKNINIAILNDVGVPLPPLAEQDEIVRRVEALFKLADAVEKRVAAATARADKLTQAILAKAFRGELVPTEAELARREGRDYEPAAALLERIGADRRIVRSSRTQGSRARQRRT